MKEEDKEPDRKEIKNETVTINMSDINIIISDLRMGEERNTAHAQTHTQHMLMHTHLLTQREKKEAE